jgi:hypothetical protein
MANTVQIMGLGGSLRAASTSRTAGGRAAGHDGGRGSRPSRLGPRP